MRVGLGDVNLSVRVGLGDVHLCVSIKPAEVTQPQPDMWSSFPLSSTWKTSLSVLWNQFQVFIKGCGRSDLLWFVENLGQPLPYCSCHGRLKRRASNLPLKASINFEWMFLK